MSFQFILGGSGSGKSALLHKLAVEQSLAEPGRQVLVIVPEQYTLMTQRQVLQAHPRHAMMNIDVLSFERLALHVFSDLGENMDRFLDDAGKGMILRRLLAEHEKELHVFRGNIRRQGFVEEMKTMISELLQYAVSPQLLRQKAALVSSDTRLFEKLHDIGLIYSSFMDFIHEKYMTSEEVLERLAQLAPSSDFIRGSLIYMDNFTGFTPVQYHLMRALMTTADSLTMTLTVRGEGSFENPEPDDLFYLTKVTQKKLEKICREEGIPRGEDRVLHQQRRFLSSGAGDLAALEAGLFSRQAAPLRGQTPQLTLLRCADPEEEIRCIASQIHALVRGGMHYSDIAVAAGDLERFTGHARIWFRRYDIPCFFDCRRDISENMLVRFIKSLLDMLEKNFSYETTFAWLRSGLTVFADEDVDQLENYCLKYGIRNLKKWKREWTMADGEEEKKLLPHLNELREAFLNPLGELTAHSPGASWQTTELIRALYRCLVKIGVKEKISQWQQRFEDEGDLDRARQYSQIYDVLIGVLERIHMILGSEKLTVREFSDVLEAGLSQVKIGVIPPGADQVTFGDIRRTRLDNVKVLFFAGMNEGIVPRTGVRTGIITDQERELLAECDLELAPMAREDIRTERFYIYACLTKPSQRLVVSWSDRDMAGKEELPSGVLRDICGIFPDLKEGSGKELLQAGIDVCSAWGSMLDGLADSVKGRRPDQSWLQTAGWFLASGSYGMRSRQIWDAAFFRHSDEKLSAAAIDAVYGKSLSGGITMLERYAACAYAHFLEYGLRLAPRRVYELSPPDIGTLMHRILQLFTDRVRARGRTWHDLDDGTRDELALRCVRDAAQEYGFGIFSDTGRGKFQLERISETARFTIWALQQQIIKGQMEPEKAELPFRLQLAAGQGRELYLRGRIDRVDSAFRDGCKYLRVLDYKTGKTDFSYPRIYYGLQMQLLFYMDAVCRQAGAGRGPALPAGTFYYNVDIPLLNGSGEADLETRPDPQQILSELALKGVSLADEDLTGIRLMDADPGRAPRVLPLRVKKDGTLYKDSSVVNEEQFREMSDYVKKKAGSLSGQLFGGRIAVDPCRLGSGSSSCTYCSMRAVCGFDASIEGFRIRNLPGISKDEFFNSISKGGGGNGK